MAKYNERLVEKIAALVEEDVYSITEICEALRISRKTFYEWRETKLEFSKALEEAENRRDEELLKLARTSLRKKLEGYTLIEERITYVPDKNNPDHLTVKNKVVKRKYCPPDNTAIKQVLERHEEKQKALEAKKALEKPEEKDELIVEFNSDKARRNYEFMTAMLKAGVPHERWEEWKYNPAYLNKEKDNQSATNDDN